MASTATQSRALTRKKPSKSQNTSSYERTRMVAEAAYYIAEQRGFSGGDPVQDWLNAEMQVDQVAVRT